MLKQKRIKMIIKTCMGRRSWRSIRTDSDTYGWVAFGCLAAALVAAGAGSPAVALSALIVFVAALGAALRLH
jgi:hypothetical protein